MDLPPGFRFHPTDEELITHYLTKKAMDETFSTRLMAEVDLNKCEPWDLPMAGRDQMGEKELYLLCKKDRKYPTGMRANRATGAGYWKATGKDKEVCRGKTLVGMKKTLVFYKGRAPKGEKTNWVMHEYRLEQGSSSSSSYHSSYNNFARPPKSEWVLCRVFNKSSGVNKASTFGRELGSSSPLTPLMDVTCFSTAMEEEFFTSFDGSHGGNLEEFMEMETKYSRNGIGRQIDGHEGPIQLTWAYAT